jgi:hypothetical protein
VLQLTAPWRFDPSPYSNYEVEAETLAVSVPTKASAFDPSPYSIFFRRKPITLLSVQIFLMLFYDCLLFLQRAFLF